MKKNIISTLACALISFSTLANDTFTSTETAIKIHPMQKQENLQFYNSSEICFIEIMNIDGEIVKKQESQSFISLTGIPSGIYSVRITFQDKTEMQTIAIER